MTSTSTAVAVSPRAPTSLQAPRTLPALQALAEGLAPQLARVVAGALTPQRIAAVLLVEAQRVPRLLECTAESLTRAMLLCGQLGLEPGGALGHVYLLPYADRKRDVVEAQVIVGYKGLAELVRRSGAVQRVNAGVVYKAELKRGLFRATIEPPTIAHELAIDVDRSDRELVAAYALADTEQGRVQVVLSREEIEARRARGKARDYGPWTSDYAAMARKSALRALLAGGLVPLSQQLADVIQAEVDEEIETRDEKQAEQVQAIYAEVPVLAPPQAPAPSLPAAAEPPTAANAIAALIESIAQCASRDELIGLYRSSEFEASKGGTAERKAIWETFRSVAKRLGWADGKAFLADVKTPPQTPPPIDAPSPPPAQPELAIPGPPGPSKVIVPEIQAITAAAGKDADTLAALFLDRMATWAKLDAASKAALYAHLTAACKSVGIEGGIEGLAERAAA